MTTQVSYNICAKIEGPIDEVLVAEIPKAPTLAEVLATLKTLAVIVEFCPELRANTTAQIATQKAAVILAAFPSAH